MAQSVLFVKNVTETIKENPPTFQLNDGTQKDMAYNIYWRGNW